jgi:hypothetical protein
MASKNSQMTGSIQPRHFLKHLNQDGGMPYSPGMPSFSEPTLLMILALIASGDSAAARPLTEWAMKNRNADGSIGLNAEFAGEGLWNSAPLAIAFHNLGFTSERDAAVEFLLQFRSIRLERNPDNDVDTKLVGWPWVPSTFGWVEPTAWALLALTLAGKSDHLRAIEGRMLLEDRCLPDGGWNYGNKMVFGQRLVPFWDTTALAALALGDSNRELLDKNLNLLEKSLPEMHSLLSNAWACLCFTRHGRKTDAIRGRIEEILANTSDDNLNLAHLAIGFIALSNKKVLTQ